MNLLQRQQEARAKSLEQLIKTLQKNKDVQHDAGPEFDKQIAVYQAEIDAIRGIDSTVPSVVSTIV